MKPAENDVALGIARVQKLMTYEIMALCQEQEMQQEEFYLYRYDPDSIEKGVEKPIKDNDHCCDASRYLVMGFWKYIKNLLPKSERGDK